MLIELSGTGLTPADVIAVAREGARAVLSDEGRRAMEDSAAVVARMAASEEAHYGVSTGFGSLATVLIEPERREELQRALIRSHAAGMGPPVEREVVRAMMLLRARTLAIQASAQATEVLAMQHDLRTSMIIGQIRATAVDLLRASGLDGASAREAIPSAPTEHM